MSSKKRRSSGAVLLLTGLLACNPFGTDREVRLRVENASDLTFDSVSLFTDVGIDSHVDVEPGQMTPFVTVEVAYGIATTEVVIGADTVRLQVIDFVGETPLSNGNYTYVLDVEGPVGNRQLLQSLREDP